MKSFTPFIVIGICIALYYLYIGPTYSDIGALQQKKSDYTSALSNIQQLKSHRDSVLLQYNAIAPEDIAKLQKIIPATSNSVDIVSNINAIASQYGMSVRQVKISQSQVSNRVAVNAASVTPVPYQITNIIFTTTAPYMQFMMFLKDLESNVRLFDITSLSISNGQKATSGGTFDYTIGFNAYSLH